MAGSGVDATTVDVVAVVGDAAVVDVTVVAVVVFVEFKLALFLQADPSAGTQRSK